MNDRIFVDTNILIYLYSTEIAKQQRIISLLKSENTFCTSIHVIMEFCHILIKKLHYTRPAISLAIRDFQTNFEIAGIGLETIEKALFIQEKYRYAFFDSLVLATALMADCTAVYSEDMQHEQLIEEQVKIVNPFEIPVIIPQNN